MQDRCCNTHLPTSKMGCNMTLAGIRGRTRDSLLNGQAPSEVCKAQLRMPRRCSALYHAGWDNLQLFHFLVVELVQCLISASTSHLAYAHMYGGECWHHHPRHR